MSPIYESPKELPTGWEKVNPSDKAGCEKYIMTEKTHDSMKKKIIALSVVTLGVYYLILKCTKGGKKQLDGLKNWKAARYVKTSSGSNGNQSSTETTSKTHTTASGTDPF